MGANKGKLALKEALPSIATEGKVSSETLESIFAGYAGKDAAVMTPRQLQRLFRDVVDIQKEFANKIYNEGLKLFQSAPGYQQMSTFERAFMNTSIAAMKHTIFAAFTVAMSFYTNIVNIQAIHRRFSPDGMLTKELFIKSGPGILLSELGKQNLIVAADIFKKLNKR